METITLLFNSTLIILLSVFFSLKFIINYNKPQYSPSRLPIIGNLHQIIRKPLHQSLHELAQKYGPLMLLYLGNSPVLVVSSAKITEEIMKNHDLVFSDRPTSKAVNVLLYDCCEIAFGPYSEYWRRMKKLCVVELLSQGRVEASEFVRAEEVAKMVRNISDLNGVAVDLSNILVALTSKIVSRSALGRLYKGDEQGCERFGELARNAVHLIGAFCFEDLYPSLKWLDTLTGFKKNLYSTANTLHSFLDKVIEDHQAIKCGDDEIDKKDFVDLLLGLQQNGKLGVNLTTENIKALLMDIYIGGTATSAAMIEWAMTELVKHPNVMKKAQAEVRKIVGDDKKSNVTETHVNQMKYLKFVYKEVLRLHPPVILPRATCTNTTFLGHKLPKKTTVLINAWSIQRDPLLWDNPEKFNPDRFLENDIDFVGNHSDFIPFGFGRRICPGISYANVSMEYALANLLYWFDWKLPEGITVESLDLNESHEFVIHKKTPLRLVPIPRFS